LWRDAQPLDAATRPSWLAPTDAVLYRWIAIGATATPPAADRERHDAEIAELEAAGFIVERDPIDQRVSRVYMARRDDDVWSIGIYTGDSLLTLAAADSAAPALTRDDVTDATAIAVADPFIIPAGGCWHMFFEVMTWPYCKGNIACAESDDGLRWTYRQTVLSERFHVSYPYVFEWDNAFYMVPESSQAGEVTLYRATTFPHAWSRVATLLRGGRLMDPSIFHHRGRWWMFVEASERGRHDTLRLYVAETLTGPWREHPESPIVDGDPTMARPAGRVLVQDDRVIRFAQNCRPRYGIDVRACEIIELTPTRYAERELSSTPVLTGGGRAWNAEGMHHIDAHRLDDGRWIAAVDGRAAATESS
jgi:hypothetical protein